MFIIKNLQKGNLYCVLGGSGEGFFVVFFVFKMWFTPVYLCKYTGDAFTEYAYHTDFFLTQFFSPASARASDSLYVSKPVFSFL